MLTVNLDDLETIERTAYAQGHYVIAELAGRAIDEAEAREDYEKTTETAVSDLEKERDEAQEALSELRANITDKVRELENIIDSAKRIGNRAEIEAKLSEIWSAL